MTDTISVSKETLDSQIVNTINHPNVYPSFEMLTKSKQGIHRFEVICAQHIALHFILCVVAILILNHYIDLSHNQYMNFYCIGICSVIYLLGIVFHTLQNKHQIVVKHIFKSIENIGEKGTLIYFLATLRNSSFISNKEAFTVMLDSKEYSQIFNEFERIFEIVSKENCVYRPTTPTKNLLPI